MRLYFRHRRTIDWLAASIVAIAFVILRRADLPFAFTDKIDQKIFLTTGTIAATLLGFSLAAASFLVSHTNSENMTLLKKSKSYFQLIELLQSSLWRFFGLLIASLLAFSTYQAIPSVSLPIFIAFSVSSIMAATTLIWSVSAILGLSR